MQLYRTKRYTLIKFIVLLFSVLNFTWKRKLCNLPSVSVKLMLFLVLQLASELCWMNFRVFFAALNISFSGIFLLCFLAKFAPKIPVKSAIFSANYFASKNPMKFDLFPTNYKKPCSQGERKKLPYQGDTSCFEK